MEQDINEKIASQTEKAVSGISDATTDVSSDASVKEKGKTKKKKRSAAYYAVTFFVKVGLTVLCIWVLLTYVGGVFMCHDNRSYPMIKDGDLVITYRLGEYRQGDVVVYEKDGERRFGRVIAFGGDEVTISSDRVSVNGYAIYDDTVYPTPAGNITYPYTVDSGYVFVLNDYRSDMSDSRTFGAVSEADLQGKAIFVMRRRGI